MKMQVGKMKYLVLLLAFLGVMHYVLGIVQFFYSIFHNGYTVASMLPM